MQTKDEARGGLDGLLTFNGVMRRFDSDLNFTFGAITLLPTRVSSLISPLLAVILNTHIAFFSIINPIIIPIQNNSNLLKDTTPHTQSLKPLH